jgi:uroporphyrinogen decarboxylase
MLHVCRQNVMFDLMADYPVDVIHWDDRTSYGPNVAEAQQRTDKGLSGGVSTKTLRHGTAADVLAEARDAIAQAGGTGLILAPTCTIDGYTPDANLSAMRQAVEETAKV